MSLVAHSAQGGVGSAAADVVAADAAEEPAGGSSWVIMRRYSEFEQLKKALEDKQVGLPKGDAPSPLPLP